MLTRVSLQEQLVVVSKDFMAAIDFFTTSLCAGLSWRWAAQYNGRPIAAYVIDFHHVQQKWYRDMVLGQQYQLQILQMHVEKHMMSRDKQDVATTEKFQNLSAFVDKHVASLNTQDLAKTFVEQN